MFNKVTVTWIPTKIRYALKHINNIAVNTHTHTYSKQLICLFLPSLSIALYLMRSRRCLRHLLELFLLFVSFHGLSYSELFRWTQLLDFKCSYFFSPLCFFLSTRLQSSHSSLFLYLVLKKLHQHLADRLQAMPKRRQRITAAQLRTFLRANTHKHMHTPGWRK